jgi:hypothetical protein
VSTARAGASMRHEVGRIRKLVPVLDRLRDFLMHTADVIERKDVGEVGPAPAAGDDDRSDTAAAGAAVPTGGPSCSDAETDLISGAIDKAYGLTE